jgi:predicted acetyltransferase
VAEPPRAAEEVIVRRATTADRLATSRLAQRAFSATAVDEPAVDEPAAGGRAPRAAEPPPPLTVVAEYRGQVVAVASATLRGQWFGGRRTMCAAVGGVTVGVEARGLGVGRALMTNLLTAAHEAGATTSALFPSTLRFYSELGYGIGGRRPVYALATADLRALVARRRPGLLLRRAGSGDAAAVSGLVRHRAARGSGLLDHSGADESMAEDPTGADSYVVELDGAVRGWCALGRRAPSTRDARYDLVVQDLVADSSDVELLLWRFVVADHPSALRAEAVVMPGSLMEYLDGRQEIVEDTPWAMRLLDVDAALVARGYSPGIKADLVLSVEDPVCPWNEGTRVLSVADGSARVRPAPGATPDAVVGAADLASLFTAHLDPVEAGHRGRLRGADDRTAGVLRGLFAGPRAWLAQTF